MSAQLESKLDEVLGLLRRWGRRGVVDCTQEAFNRLPGLVRRSTFMEWTGLSSEELADEVAQKRIAIYKPKGREQALYYKHEIARLTGMRM